MRESIVLTLAESDALLEILSELPIKQATIFAKVQAMLQSKFHEAEVVKEVSSRGFATELPKEHMAYPSVSPGILDNA